jgi:hypothetical protein
MTDEEIEAVAQDLAKVGGSSWYPGRTSGALLRNVSERYRDQARVAIAALDRLRGREQGAGAPHHSAASRVSESDEALAFGLNDRIQVGAIVVYRPEGEHRAISCEVREIDDGQAYLVPVTGPDVGWVSIGSVLPQTADKISGSE